MLRSKYDTVEGISKALKDLVSFNNLVKERQQAFYERKEELTFFFVLGRYVLDTCGNLGFITEVQPKDSLPNIPDVLEKEAFDNYLVEHSEEYPRQIMSWGLSYALAPVDKTCPHCEKSWILANAHDHISRNDKETFSLAEYQGETLGFVKNLYSKDLHRVYITNINVYIRNDKNINWSPKYPLTEDEWKLNIVKNEKGFISSEDGIDDNYLIQEGDELWLDYFVYYHKECNYLALAEEYQEKFKTIFEKAGFKNFEIDVIPNEYYSSPSRAPWFLVKTEFGRIKIGWRKRVINIDWTDLLDKTVGFGFLEHIFRGEDTTQCFNYIHAWGWEKAEDYLWALRQELEKYKK